MSAGDKRAPRCRGFLGFVLGHKYRLWHPGECHFSERCYRCGWPGAR